MGAMHVRQFCEIYGISRSLVYKLLGQGKLQAVKAGKAILITRESAEAWFKSLPAAQIKMASGSIVAECTRCS